MAQSVDVFSAAEIAASNVRTLPDLVSRLPGVSLYHLGAANPALAQIQMRGYGENGFGRVLVSMLKKAIDVTILSRAKQALIIVRLRLPKSFFVRVAFIGIHFVMNIAGKKGVPLKRLILKRVGTLNWVDNGISPRNGML